MVYNGEVYNHPELRAELGPAASASRPTSDTEVVLRLLERDGLGSARPPQRPVRARLVEPAAAPADAGARPLRRAPAALRAARRRQDRLRLGGQGAVRLRRGRRAAPDLAGSTRSSRSGGRAPPRTRVRRRRQLPPGRPARLGARRDRRRSGGGGSRDYGDAEPAPPRRARASCCATASGCACAPTCRSAPTSPAASTRASSPRSPSRRPTTTLRTFSVAFRDPRFDERAFQEQVARQLGTRHHVVEVGRRRSPTRSRTSSGTPRRRSSAPRRCRSTCSPARPASRASRSSRRARAPTSCSGATTSSRRPRPARAAGARPGARRRRCSTSCTVPRRRGRRGEARRGAGSSSSRAAGRSALGSHQTARAATRASRRFYRPEVARRRSATDPLERLRAELPGPSPRWTRLERAAYLELTTLLGPPARRAGRPRRHGARRRGPLPVPRPPRLRALGRACRRAQARRAAARRSRCARWPRRCCPRAIAARAEAALPRARGRRRSSARARPRG